MTTTSPVLVMGARSGIGRLVLDQLVSENVLVRASTRRLERGRFGPGLDAVEADLTDPTSLRRAFDGMAAVFLFAVPDRLAQVVRAVQDAGIERVVLVSSGSVLLPGLAGNSITVEHRRVEEAFAAAARSIAGFDFVPLRPLVLASNALGWAGQIAATDEVRLYRPDALNAPIHEADVAAVAVAALTAPTGSSDDQPFGALLTGPRQLSQREQVAAIAAARGRDITVHSEDRSEALERFGRFMTADEAAAVLDFIDDCAAGNSPATDAVARVLGRPALGYEAWARLHATDFLTQQSIRGQDRLMAVSAAGSAAG